MSGQKTCLVIGAGAGIGGTVGKRFAEGGYHAALCRRSLLLRLDHIHLAITLRWLHLPQRIGLALPIPRFQR